MLLVSDRWIDRCTKAVARTTQS